MKICVLIPVYNESMTIESLVSGVIAKGLHCVVIDDGCTDGTGDLAQRLGAHVIRHPKKSGKGAALRRGFHYAARNGFDAVITMDGDGQHAVDDLDVFLKAVHEGKGDLIIGNRMFDSRGMPLIRVWTNRLMSWLISWICRQKIMDTQCGYRLIRTEVLNMIAISTSAYEIESEVLIHASRCGFKILSVPVQTIYANEHSKINPLSDTFRFIRFYLKELFMR